MDWRIEFSPAASREIRKLDRELQRRVLAYLEALTTDCDNPRQRGKGLTSQRSGLWRYRVGDLRVICKIQDHELIVLVVNVSHRSSAYG